MREDSLLLVVVKDVPPPRVGVWMRDLGANPINRSLGPRWGAEGAAGGLNHHRQHREGITNLEFALLDNTVEEGNCQGHWAI